MGKFEAILTAVFVFVAVIALAVWGWSSLPEHDAKAEQRQALIPYWQQQAEIETNERMAAAAMKEERWRAAQPYRTAALIGLWLAVVAGSMAGSGFVINAAVRRGQRLSKEMALPVVKEVAPNFVALEQGGHVLLLNTVSGKSHGALTPAAADETFAEIMSRVMLAKQLTDGVTAVAKHTGDPSSIDFLLGQVQNVTDATTKQITDQL